MSFAVMEFFFIYWLYDFFFPLSPQIWQIILCLCSLLYLHTGRKRNAMRKLKVSLQVIVGYIILFNWQ